MQQIAGPTAAYAIYQLGTARPGPSCSASVALKLCEAEIVAVGVQNPSAYDPVADPVAVDQDAVPGERVHVTVRGSAVVMGSLLLVTRCPSLVGCLWVRDHSVLHRPAPYLAHSGDSKSTVPRFPYIERPSRG